MGAIYIKTEKDVKARDVEVDIAKCICIICMVLVHATYGNHPIINTYTGVFFLVFFFFSAGFYLKKTNDPTSFIARRLERLEVPYVLVCLIIFGNMFIKGYRNATVLINSLFYALPSGFASPYMIAGTSTIGIGPIWFLNCLFFASLLHLPLLQLEKKRRTIIVLILALAGKVSQKYFLFPFAIQDALIGMLFLHMGKVLYPYIQKGMKWLRVHLHIDIAIVLSVLFLYVWEIRNLPYQWFNLGGNLYHFHSLPGTFTGFALVLLAAVLIAKIPVVGNIMAYFGANSMVLLVIHSLDITTLRNWAGWGSMSWAGIILTIVLYAASTVVYVEGKKRLQSIRSLHQKECE